MGQNGFAGAYGGQDRDQGITMDFDEAASQPNFLIVGHAVYENSATHRTCYAQLRLNLLQGDGSVYLLDQAARPGLAACDHYFRVTIRDVVREGGINGNVTSFTALWGDGGAPLLSTRMKQLQGD